MNEKMIYTKSGYQISNGFTRVVQGRRRSYVEINKEQIIKENLIIPLKESYRLKNNRVYYVEYRTKRDNVKIYFQKRRVKYADYKISFYYVSIKDVKHDFNLYRKQNLNRFNYLDLNIFLKKSKIY